MATTPISRMLWLMLIGAGGLLLALAFQYMPREPQVATKAVPAASTTSKPASDVQKQVQAPLPKAQVEVKALADALAGSPPPPDISNNMPAFDIARVEPTGEAVIAGRAAPGATVELLRDGQVHDRAVADQSGQFAMVPPQLPSGRYDLTLRSKQSDGTQVTSKQNVTVDLEPSSKERPVVALVTPDKPTVVLSQPATPKPASGTVVVDAVDIEPDGKLHVSGRAGPGAAVRFYLNDSFVASVTAGGDGRFAITVNEGVVAGNYRVRLDEVELNSGKVRARAEVPLNVPGRVATASAASAPAKTAASKQLDVGAATQPSAVPQRSPVVTPQPLAAPQRQATAPEQQPAATVPPENGSPSNVTVPRIKTATIARGDNLWQISQLTYGAGIRYSVIYKANREQIRNPNLIYPGQVFVLPSQ